MCNQRVQHSHDASTGTDSFFAAFPPTATPVVANSQNTDPKRSSLTGSLSSSSSQDAMIDSNFNTTASYAWLHEKNRFFALAEQSAIQSIASVFHTNSDNNCLVFSAHTPAHQEAYHRIMNAATESQQPQSPASSGAASLTSAASSQQQPASQRSVDYLSWFRPGVNCLHEGAVNSSLLPSSYAATLHASPMRAQPQMRQTPESSLQSSLARSSPQSAQSGRSQPRPYSPILHQFVS